MKVGKMSSEHPVCLGCNLNPNWHIPAVNVPDPLHRLDYIHLPPPPSFSFCQHQGLTDGEKEVLNALKEAWEKFAALGHHVDHDCNEFNYAIHMAQQKIAMRVARRVDPDVWRQPQSE